MSRAELASAGVRGRSDGRVERRAVECVCVHGYGDIVDKCLIIASEWFCSFCGHKNPPTATVVCNRCAVMRVINT